jgi:hypothetical protein
MSINNSASYTTLENHNITNFLNQHPYVTLIILVYLITYLIVWFSLFKKAKRPGWAAFIPLYNIYTIGKVANRMNLAYVTIMVSLIVILFSLPLTFYLSLVIIYLYLFISLLYNFSKKFNTNFGVILLCQYLPFIGIFFLDNIALKHNKNKE